MKKTYEWNLTDGRKITLEAEYEETVRDKVVNLDGDICNTGDREIVTDAMLIAYIDGKQFDFTRYVNFWEIVDADKHRKIKKIRGIKQIAFTEERAKEIEAFLTNVIEEGRDEEAQKIRDMENEKKKKNEIEEVKRIIEKAEKQKDIPNRAEAERRMKRYNDINNDGGEGYVPYIISLEEYEYAKEKLAKLTSC
jgi:hypothetical protein